MARISDPFWVTFHFITPSKRQLLAHCVDSAHLGWRAALTFPGVPQPLLGWIQLRNPRWTFSPSIKLGG